MTRGQGRWDVRHRCEGGVGVKIDAQWPGLESSTAPGWQADRRPSVSRQPPSASASLREVPPSS